MHTACTHTLPCQLPGLGLAPSAQGPTCPTPLQGVVTAAVSLITCLCKKNPDDFKTCISLAVSRLSRVRVVPMLAVGGGAWVLSASLRPNQPSDHKALRPWAGGSSPLSLYAAICPVQPPRATSHPVGQQEEA